MTTGRLKGLRHDETVDQRQLRRDVRTAGERLVAALARPKTAMTVMAAAGLAGLSWPGWCFHFFLAAAAVLAAHWLAGRPKGLPLRLPRRLGRPDPNSPGPGRRGFNRAAGVLYLGNELEEGLEIWLGQKDLLAHLLVLGTTGSGKTQALVSLAYNALLSGSGLFYIDPKSSSELPMQIWGLARYLGREDDFRVLNYACASSPEAAPERAALRASNTNNPFSLGSADSLTQLLASLMPPSEGGNSIFADKALTLIAGLMYALTDLRDQGLIQLSASTVRECLSAENCVALLGHPALGEAAKASLRAALLNCNWVESKALAQQPTFFEQYGYAQSYFGRALSSLTDAYGRIYGAERGEVDFRDVVLNRRILVTLLPSMEKSPAELASLGKVTLSAVRSAAAVGLGTAVEGRERDVLGALPVHFMGTGPFMSVVDEYAAIVTPGFEMLLTQGRGLGMATVVASQDYAGLLEADRKGAQQIVANTNLKIFMRTEDPEKTVSLLKAMTGEEAVWRTTGSALDVDSSLGGVWRDNQAAAVQSRQVSDFADVTGQLEGEAHCVFRGRLFRARLFYAAPGTKGAVTRIHRLLQIEGPH
jgi:intracellular multiplication protein IcmO